VQQFLNFLEELELPPLEELPPEDELELDEELSGITSAGGSSKETRKEQNGKSSFHSC